MPPETRAGAGSGLRDLVRAIVSFAGPRMPKTLLVVGLAALLEGAGLVLLLPVAEIIFAQEGAARSGLTADFVGWLAERGVDTVMEQLALIGTGFVLLVLLRAIVLLKRDVLMMQLSQGFVDDIRRDFFALLARADWPVIKRFRKAQLLNTMTTNIARLAQTMHALSHGMIMVAMGLAYLAAAFLVSKVLGLALLALGAIGIASALAWTRRSHRLGERLTGANMGVMKQTTLFLDGMKAAKAARAEEQLTRRFVESIAETRAVNVEFVEQQARLRNSVQLIASLGALAVLLVGFGLVGLTGGELLVMAAIVIRLAPNLVGTFSSLQSVAHALPAFEAIRAIEAQLQGAQTQARADPSEASTPIADDAALMLRNCRVDVTGDDGGTVTLVQADAMTVAPGQLVHIGGRSGSGKSTLVELVAGLHLPAGGTVQWGDVALTAATRALWQSRVSFAPQEPFLFDGTVRENLLWPNMEAGDDALWDVLDMADARDIVEGLAGALDEPLLDGGARLSGGERQRLCLARALLRPASLLILDEATSAMDPELERRIVGRLRDNIGHRIVLMVSHSLNAAGHADLRVKVTDGVARIVG